MQGLLDILGNVGFDWRMALFNLINFLIVFAILTKFAFEPIMKVIAERQRKMTEGVENFERSKSELRMAEQKAQGIIDDAKVEANKIAEKATDDAKEITVQMKDKAKGEIELLISQAKRNIEIDREEMKQALSADTGKLVVAAVEKIIGEKLDAKKDAKFIEQILTSVEK